MGYIGNQSAGITYTNINTFRGKVSDLTALSAVSGMGNGDLYITEDNNHAHMYTGTVWVDLGEITGPQGPIGPKGIAGASVSTVIRTTGDGSAGTTDVYTITYDDATTSTFEVYNGKDGKDGLPGTIDHIARTAGTGASGTTDTYTAYADAAETQLLGTFDVYNGYDGVASTIGTLVDVDLTTVPVEAGQTIIWNEVEGKWLPGDVSSSAINMTYDNTTSALTATDVQGAIDEIENSVNEIENSAVKLTGDQTIEDIKTFTSSPIVPTPTTNAQVANKNYVDVSISNLDVGVPSGAILMWSGGIATIPTSWALCDGTNGTPDLRDRFIVGAGSTYSVGGTGGSKDAIVVAHTHTGSTNSAGVHTHTVSHSNSGTVGINTIAGSNTIEEYSTKTTSAAGAFSSSLTTNSAGESGVNKNLPPYYSLAYIMKI